MSSSLSSPTSFFEQVFRNAPWPIFRINADGKLLLINEAGKAFLKSHDAIEAETLAEAFDAELAEEFAECLRNCPPEKRCRTFQWSVSKREKEEHYHLSLYRGGEDCLLIAEDQTEKVSLTKQLTKMQGQLKVLADQRTSFLARLSHELRTPLNGIISSTELLHGTKLPSNAQDYITIIDESAQKLQDLFDGLIDYADMQKGEFEIRKVHFSLQDLVEDVASDMAFQAHRKGLNILVDIDAQTPDDVVSDPFRIRQVFRQLLQNAIKFTDEGEITVRVALKGEAANKYFIECVVEDTGAGIDSGNLNELFTAFRQQDEELSRAYGGLGLGLTLCKQILSYLDGDIALESESGKGTTVRFTIGVGVHTDESMNAYLPFRKLSGRRVLLIEKQASTRRLLSDLLRRWGLDTVEAGDYQNGFERWKLAKLHHNRFDYIIVGDSPAVKQADELIRNLYFEGEPNVLLLLETTSFKERSEYFRQLGYTESVLKPVRQRVLIRQLAKFITTHDDAGTKEELLDELPMNALAKVLIVEDDPINGRLLRELLARIDVASDLATHGAEGVKLTFQNQYDLIFMDIQMPQMDGIEAITAIRTKELADEVDGQTPIVVLSALAEKTFRNDAIEAGADGWLSKPATLMQLKETVARWIPAYEDSRRNQSLGAHGVSPARQDVDCDLAITLTYVGGDKLMVQSIADTVVKEAPAQLEELRRACDGLEAKALYLHAHKLKGGLSYLGSKRCVEICQRLQDAGESGDLNHARKDFGKLEMELKRLVAYLASPEFRSDLERQ